MGEVIARRRCIDTFHWPVGVELYNGPIIYEGIGRQRYIDSFHGPVGVELHNGTVTDTVLNFALKTGYDIDTVREERKLRQLVSETFIYL